MSNATSPPKCKICGQPHSGTCMDHEARGPLYSQVGPHRGRALVAMTGGGRPGSDEIDAGSSNGRTAAFEAVNSGSNPEPATSAKAKAGKATAPAPTGDSKRRGRKASSTAPGAVARRARYAARKGASA